MTEWAPVLELTSTTEELRTLWRQGAVANPAAPPGLRIRVIEECAAGDPLLYGLTYLALPEPVVDAWIAHPVAKVRARAAERSGLTGAQRRRLLRDPSAGVRRAALFFTAADEVLEEAEADRFLADPSPLVRAELALQRNLSVAQLAVLLGDPSCGVRAPAVGRAWPHLDGAARAALLADPHSGVRAEALLARYADEPLPEGEFRALTDGCEEADRLRIIGKCLLERELADSLARGGSGERRALAGNPRLDADLVAVLARDGDPAVRLAVSLRPELSEAERAGVPVEVDPNGRYDPLPWVLERRGDVAHLRRCAASAHVLLRRSVAHVRDLPPDVVELLARDEDFAVRLLLAENCAQAPAGLLLEMWVRWGGYSRGRLREHPNFPRTGVLRFAADPDPWLRRLALDDPAASAELVERCARDEDGGVRLRALEDPRLSAASVVRLLDDEDWLVRRTALRDPRLPDALLAGLLTEARTAEGAAGHPAVPAAVLAHLLALPVV
ncbi:PE-PGRS family protein [Kitasatospora sp. NPDC057692]|uniref:PE-PGRS family protein n=1 Tax=Kitasatospora sp. NPDC057692 TaxID=3346215 RepID=UPI0036891216